jgi:hypothetical protein
MLYIFPYQFESYSLISSSEILNHVVLFLMGRQVMSKGKGVESANKYARKWPILPFDVSRDFIISKAIIV